MACVGERVGGRRVGEFGRPTQSTRMRTRAGGTGIEAVVGGDEGARRRVRRAESLEEGRLFWSSSTGALCKGAAGGDHPRCATQRELGVGFVLDSSSKGPLRHYSTKAKQRK